MRAFYAFMLFWSQMDVAIGEATGRSSKFIAADRLAVSRWRTELQNAQLPTLEG